MTFRFTVYDSPDLPGLYAWELCDGSQTETGVAPTLSRGLTEIAAARLRIDHIIDVPNFAAGIEVKEVEHFLHVLLRTAELMPAHAGLEGHQTRTIPDEGHLDIQLCPIRVGNALHHAQLELGGDFTL